MVSRWLFVLFRRLINGDNPKKGEKKLRNPFLAKFTEAETPQVTPAKLPYGTRELPLRAATFLS